MEEARADYIVYEIKPHDQPDWFRTKVSPLGKVRVVRICPYPDADSAPLWPLQIPVITFGGPDVPPDQPSAESVKLFESLPLLEFCVDVFPEANFLPADPVLRAKARAFIAIYENYVNNPFIDVLLYRKPVDSLLQGLERLQAALPPTGFAIGEWSMAEIGVVPFLARMFFYLEHDIGNYDEEGEKKMRDAFASTRFARLRKYVQEASERPSFKTSWISDVSISALLAALLFACMTWEADYGY